ncbi:MAG: hypothetical protein R3E13_08325 [Alphaproteobacteria bacterium]
MKDQDEHVHDLTIKFLVNASQKVEGGERLNDVFWRAVQFELSPKPAAGQQQRQQNRLNRLGSLADLAKTPEAQKIYQDAYIREDSMVHLNNLPEEEREPLREKMRNKHLILSANGQIHDLVAMIK